MTGRLATLEEIVDWQPYEHLGWRTAMPGIGRVVATADLEPVDGGTRVLLRWRHEGEAADAAEVRRLQIEKEAAFGRLGRLLGGALPVVTEPSRV